MTITSRQAPSTTSLIVVLWMESTVSCANPIFFVNILVSLVICVVRPVAFVASVSPAMEKGE